MSNMSYCRYQNTLIDLQDCYYALQDEFPADPDDDEATDGPATISKDEAEARKALVELCIVIGEEFSDLILGKTGEA